MNPIDCPLCGMDLGLDRLYLHIVDVHPASDLAINIRLELLLANSGVTL